MLPRREHSFFGDDSDDSVVDGGHGAIHDDVDESADASELDVSDQGPVEPVHEVVPEDLQAEIDFVETASRHELLGSGSKFNCLGDDDGEPSSGAFGGDGADDDCSCSTTESSRRMQSLAKHSKKKAPMEHSQVRLPISITAAPHQGLQLGVQAIHRRRHSCTPQAFCEARPPTYCVCLEGKCLPSMTSA